MKKKLLGLTGALAVTALASWTGSAEATIYCSPGFCADKPLTTECPCSPDSDKDGFISNCEEYGGISSNGCWYF